MKIIENISINIDFASNYRIVGWALDIENKSFPTNLKLKNFETKNEMEISESRAIYRQDVLDNFNLTSSVRIGFDLNLFDIFNSRPNDYSILIGSTEVWSYSEFINDININSTICNSNLPRQTGNSQIFIIYEKNGWLHASLKKINNWNPLYFDKRFQSGVSFYFSAIDELETTKKSFMDNKQKNNLLILDRSIYRDVIRNSQTMASHDLLGIIDEYVNYQRDYIGLTSVIYYLTNINNFDLLNPSRLAIFFTAISGYKNLFFDNTNGLYTYLSGVKKSWMIDYVKYNAQDNCSEDILILSDAKLDKLSDINIKSTAIYIKTTALRFLLDSLNADSTDFLKIAFRRGRSIKNISKGQL